jgi:hypothetical protein
MLEAQVGFGGSASVTSTTKRISISTAELLATHNFNVLGSPVQADMAVTGDPERRFQRSSRK